MRQTFQWLTLRASLISERNRPAISGVLATSGRRILEGDVLVEHLVVRVVDRAHAPRGQEGDDR